MKDLEKLILEKIKNEKITPIPRWQFILLNVLMWSAVVLAVVLGSLAFGVILDVIFGASWGVMERAGQGKVMGFLVILPYLWILVLVLAFILAWKIFPHTRSGYRYTPKKITSIIFIFSILGGVVFWQTRLSHHADRWSLETLPPQMQLEQNIKNQIMGGPEAGMLGGFVLEVKEDELRLEDIFGGRWNVKIEKIEQIPQEKHLIFFGKKLGEFMFEAEEVLTLRGGMPEKFCSKKMKDCLGNESNR